MKSVCLSYNDCVELSKHLNNRIAKGRMKVIYYTNNILTG